MAAIQYLNGYYMGQNLQHESQFVWQCMTHLEAATKDLAKANGAGEEDAPLLCIQRALLLLKTHMETFRKRWSNSKLISYLKINLFLTGTLIICEDGLWKVKV